MFEVACLLMTLGVIGGVAWLIHRAYEELHAYLDERREV